MSVFEVLDILGTVSFAISGALIAMRKRFDPFGVFIIGFVTALGGGTLRDILIGNLPVNWTLHIETVFVVIFSVILAMILRGKLKYVNRSLFLFDTIGLGIFTIVGTEIGIKSQFHPMICVALGTISASFGGVIRDILCNEIPIIFRKEIYATPCIVGASIFILLHHLQVDTVITYIVTTSFVIAIRLIAVKFKLYIPAFYANKV